MSDQIVSDQISPDQVRFEVCVDSVEAAVAAQEGGAQGVELCANLLEGGATPSAAVIQLARESTTIDLNVMIRPRGGDFLYSDTEFECMRRDIELAKEWEADGVVFGILRRDGTVDVERTGVLVSLARPMGVTFHRAFDMSRDPHEALEDLIRVGIGRVLTSGQEISALEGLDLITDLVKKAGDRITVMPGGGITERNIKKIIDASGAREIHFAAMRDGESGMMFRDTHSFMGGEFRAPEYMLSVTDPARVRAFVQAGQG